MTTPTPPPPMPPRPVVAAAAIAIAVCDPPREGWAMPRANWIRILRRAGWPISMATIDMPQYEHRGPRIGQRTSNAPATVVTVPASWLRILAESLDVSLADACRGIIDDGDGDDAD